MDTDYILRKVGDTSIIIEIAVGNSSVTTGAGLTGLTFGSAGLTAKYKRSNGTASVAITLADIPTLGTFASGGFKEVDAAGMSGIYEFHPPDAAFASGAKWVTITLQGAANMRPRSIHVQLVNFEINGSTGYIDAQVKGMDSNVLTAAAINADAITAAKVAADVGTELADALLKRDMSAVTGEAARSPLNALRLLRNKVSVSGGVKTVTKEDDTTTAFTTAVTTDAAALPIVADDPA